MEDILQLARRLGKAIADSPQAVALHAARAELDKHEDLKKLVEDYQAQVQKVAELREANKPIEVDDKHRLNDLHGRLVAADVFKKYTAAQVEYVDLMRKATQAMQQPMDE